jgi:hypothetical protein
MCQFVGEDKEAPLGSQAWRAWWPEALASSGGSGLSQLKEKEWWRFEPVGPKRPGGP